MSKLKGKDCPKRSINGMGNFRNREGDGNLVFPFFVLQPSDYVLNGLIRLIGGLNTLGA